MDNNKLECKNCFFNMPDRGKWGACGKSSKDHKKRHSGICSTHDGVFGDVPYNDHKVVIGYVSGYLSMNEYEKRLAQRLKNRAEIDARRK